MDDPDYYEIQESKCDFALLIQRFIQEGWQFVDINYGERSCNSIRNLLPNEMENVFN